MIARLPPLWMPAPSDRKGRFLFKAGTGKVAAGLRGQKQGYDKPGTGTYLHFSHLYHLRLESLSSWTFFTHAVGLTVPSLQNGG